MLDDWLPLYPPEVKHLWFQQKWSEAISQCLTVCAIGKDGDSTQCLECWALVTNYSNHWIYIRQPDQNRSVAYLWQSVFGDWRERTDCNIINHVVIIIIISNNNFKPCDDLHACACTMYMLLTCRAVDVH